MSDARDSSPICSFRDEFDFLSNFHPSVITIGGETYPTAEHAFQALKTDDPDERLHVKSAPTPAGAKSRGKKVTLRPDWNEARFAVMERVLRAKFAGPELAAKLLATGERELIEGNTWRDTTWGCVRTKDGEWKGRNELGKLLMGLRRKLRQGR